jgi:hypothetical protein
MKEESEMKAVAIEKNGELGEDTMMRHTQIPDSRITWPPGHSPSSSHRLAETCRVDFDRTLSIGDRVMVFEGGGAQAEFIAVHERQLMPVSQAFSLGNCRRLFGSICHRP